MKLSMKEKKILYAFACPSHDNMVARLKWLTALTVDPEAKRWMLELARKMETEVDESRPDGLHKKPPNWTTSWIRCIMWIRC